MDWYVDLWTWALGGAVSTVLLVFAHLAPFGLLGLAITGRSSQH